MYPFDPSIANDINFKPEYKQLKLLSINEGGLFGDDECLRYLDKRDF